MPTYFTYRPTVMPGQTVKFTAGKGYYVEGSPTPTPSSTGGGATYSDANSTAGYGPGTPTPAPVMSSAPPDTGGGGGGDGGSGGSPVATALSNQPQQLVGGAGPYDTNPGYLAALAAEQAGTQQAEAALKAWETSQIVRFGDPALAQVAGLGLDPDAAAMALENTKTGNSTIAQLQKSRDLSQQGIVNTLAAHGIIRSGDLGYKSTQNQQTYGSNLYNAQQTFLDALGQQKQATLATEQGLKGQTVQALNAAYALQVGNPGFYPQMPDTSTPNGSTTSYTGTGPYPYVAAPVTPGGPSSNTAGGGATYSDANSTGGYAPVTAALSQPSPPKTTSRLAAAPVANPFKYQVARNVRAG